MLEGFLLYNFETILVRLLLCVELGGFNAQKRAWVCVIVFVQGLRGNMMTKYSESYPSYRRKSSRYKGLGVLRVYEF